MRRRLLILVSALGACAVSLAASGALHDGGPPERRASAPTLEARRTTTTTAAPGSSPEAEPTPTTEAAAAATTAEVPVPEPTAAGAGSKSASRPTTATRPGEPADAAAAATVAGPSPDESGTESVPATPGAPRTSVPATTATSPAGAPHQRMYAYYYLWWSDRHWHDKLGGSFPYGAAPLPLPADLDASGCSPVSRYEGNQLIDSPASLAMADQDQPGVIESDVRTAAAAGLAGFIVNWRGNGSPNQATQDVSYTRRLAEVVRAVDEVNAEGTDFKLWISYKASASIVELDDILGDFTYLARTYATSAAFDRTWSSRPTIVWTGSKKYPLDVVRRVSDEFRGTFQLIGDETLTTWGDGRAAHLDGAHYYWSSQNPYTNPASFKTLASLAATIRASGPNPDGTPKRWFAPLTPGYNSILLGGSTCVPRNDGQTMRDLFAGNRRSVPDGWAFISWNEIAEGTYVLPLQRWGSGYLDVLRSLTATP